MTTIKLKNGSGAPTSGDLVQGEPALDLTNKRLYTEDSGGTVIEVGTNPSTINIDAGTIDGTVIGGSTAAAGSFTTFTSTGIDDNAASTAMTLDSSGNVGIGTTSPVADSGYSSVTLDGSTGSQLFLRGAGTDRGLIWVSSNFNIEAKSTTPMVFRTNNSEAMRIDSSGNVGIGTSSPQSSQKLHIANTSGHCEMTLQSGDSSTAALLFGDATDFSRGKIAYTNSDDNMVFQVNNLQEAMRIDSNGQVGIGVTPSNWSSSANKVLQIRESGFLQQDNVTNVGLGRNAFQSGAWSYIANGYAQMFNLESDGAFKFFQAGSGTAGNTVSFSQAMTLDASGNLLVGKTDTTGNVAGVSLRSTGLIVGTVSSGTVGYFNRTTSDGTILDFRKDNVAVGSIGAKSADLCIGTDDTGIRFGDGGNSVIPHNMTTNVTSDGVINFGTATERFKDLYLSGGAYLGGTGSANKLDDYEEGTFTPVITGTTGTPTVTYYTQSGTYTKIGRTVYYRIGLRVNTISGGSGILRVTGLPFTAKGYSAYTNPFGMVNNGGLTTSQEGPFILYVEGGATSLQARYANTNADSVFPLGLIQAGTYFLSEGFYEVS